MSGQKNPVPAPVFYLILAIVLYGTWLVVETLPIQEEVKLIVALVLIAGEAYYLQLFFKGKNR